MNGYEWSRILQGSESALFFCGMKYQKKLRNIFIFVKNDNVFCGGFGAVGGVQ